MPTEHKVELPSRGYFYGGKLPGGNVTVRPMTTQEEKLLVGSQDRLAIVDTVVERCLLTKSMPLDEYLLNDEFFMLLFIRNITYGANYSFTIKCPSCGTSFNHEVKVPDGMKLTVLTEKDKEPFECELPIAKKKLSLRLLRVADEKEIRRYTTQVLNRPGRGGDGDVAYTYRLARHIVKIDGEEIDSRKALELVDGMGGGDSLVLRNSIDAHDCGVELHLSLVCPRCEYLVERMLPFTAEFFRPKH